MDEVSLLVDVVMASRRQRPGRIGQGPSLAVHDGKCRKVSLYPRTLIARASS